MNWDINCLEVTPAFEPLRLAAPARHAGWPALPDLQQAFDSRVPPVRNARGRPLRIVPPGTGRDGIAGQYEARILVDAELTVRPRDWHDYFNALVWLAFPRAKAALNARHYDELERQRAAGERNRGPVQDALTLFDESGVIVASDDDGLLDLLRDWRWRDLFWDRRGRVAERMRFYLFGHSLYEKALRPFIGMTGRGLLFRTDRALLDAPLAEQMAALDQLAGAKLADPQSLNTTRELAVVPVLGVPGWHPDNEREGFYDNTDYFRPARRAEGESRKSDVRTRTR